MSSNKETADKVEVGPADIQITERGGVEITNIALSDKLKDALAAEKFIKWPDINIFCPRNWKCGKEKTE